ncbi:DoxX family membrane protein, partial [Gordonia aichiensis]
MLASVFIVSGYDALRNPHKRAEMAEPFLESTVGVLPDEVTSAIPTDPVTLVRVNGGVQLASGVLLATGKLPRFASAVLAASLAPTTFAGHPFWEESDPVARSMQRTHFLKNLSLMGGLLISAADTEGKPSLAWRGRRKADAALAALPIGAKAGTTAWDSIREHAQESASTLGEKSSEAAGLLKQDAHKLGERSAEAADKFRDRAPVVAENARERSAEIADKVRVDHAMWFMRPFRADEW